VILVRFPWSLRAMTTPHHSHRDKCRLCVAIVTIFAGSVLMATTAFADNEPSTTNAAPTVRMDMEIAALLARVEQLISDGRIIAPNDDNAQKTWNVVEMRATSASPGVRMALSSFAAHWRSRAVDEEKAGRSTTASYLKLFAEFATDLAARSEALAASAPQGTTPRPLAEGQSAPGASIETPRAAAGDAQTPGPLARLPAPRGQKVAPTAGLGTAKTEQPLGEPAVANASTDNRVPDLNATRSKAAAGRLPTLDLAVPAVPLATVVPAPSAQLTADASARRGDDMMAIKDISAARKYYEYAANAGSARAAAALARTLDPAFMTQLGAVGLKPDPTLAATWYRKAASLGDRDAEARLHALNTDAAR
jgi:Sel1 repeat